MVFNIFSRGQSARHIVVGIRYSLIEHFDEKVGRLAFRNAGVKTTEDYISALLDDGRLHGRLDLFKRFPLPSLLNMEQMARRRGIGFTAIVATTDLLPDHHSDALRKACSSSPAIQVVTPADGIKGAMRRAVSSLDRGTIVATVRLDDDDALSSDYVDLLAPYLSEQYRNMAISFPAGYYAYIDGDGTVSLVAPEKRPKIAIGLAFVQKVGIKQPISIYELGNHQHIDDRYPVILDARKPTFIRVAHRASDTYSQPGVLEKEMNKLKKNAVDWLSTAKQFGLP